MLSCRTFMASLAGVLLFGVAARKPRPSKPDLTLNAKGATTARAG